MLIVTEISNIRLSIENAIDNDLIHFCCKNAEGDTTVEDTLTVKELNRIIAIMKQVIKEVTNG